MTDTRVRVMHDPLRRRRRRLVVVLAVAVFAAGMLMATAAPAQAAARLTASSSLGGAVASTSGPTSFTVSGSGFQAIQGGFGGIYVGFGWVNGSNWGPSKGGSTGNSYDYVPDDQSKNNKGYQAFVAFPGSETAGEAKSTLSASGSFTIQLTVPGPTFTGAGGKKIDCRQVTCGFLTWGAHGVRNSANESFTPVTFQGGAAPAAPEPSAQTGAGQPAAEASTAATGGTAGRAGTGRAAAAGGRAQTGVQAQAQGPAQSQEGAASQGGEAPAADRSASAPAEGAAGGPVDATGGTSLSGAAIVQVDRKSARAGGAMGFAAAGFWPGEQVYVVLGDGIAAVGPVVAGVDGEVAGVIVLPDDLEPGTHEIRAAGAGSGLEASERFPLRVDIEQVSTSSTLRDSMKWVFFSLAALALLATVAFVVRRRQKTAGSPDSDGRGYDDSTGPNDYGDPDVSDGPDYVADAASTDPAGPGANPQSGAFAGPTYPTATTMQEEVQR